MAGSSNTKSNTFKVNDVVADSNHNLALVLEIAPNGNLVNHIRVQYFFTGGEKWLAPYDIHPYVFNPNTETDPWGWANAFIDSKSDKLEDIMVWFRRAMEAGK